MSNDLNASHFFPLVFVVVGRLCIPYYTVHDYFDGGVGWTLYETIEYLPHGSVLMETRRPL